MEQQKQSSVPRFHSNAIFDEVDETEAREIQWSNVIFLPFHPFFKSIIFFTVICKTILGPLQSVYPIMICETDSETMMFLGLRYFYNYFCVPLYAIDMLLHILHRQIGSERMRREHLPKSKVLLLFDLIAVIPWFRLLINVACPEPQLWPNIMCFAEVIVVYRVLGFFSLFTTHNILKLVAGVVTLLLITINCISCLLLLLTMHGLCGQCRDHLYDWRMYIEHKMPSVIDGFELYVYSTTFILSILENQMIDLIQPTTIIEFVVCIILMIFSHVMFHFFVVPKTFAETILRLRGACEFFPVAKRVIEETKIRNPSRMAQVSVQNFYSVMWHNRAGISCIPPIITELPRYMRSEIRLDLVWPVFHHSPSFRNTSESFKRWLCEFIRLDYKLPGEVFFSVPHAHTNLFYIKSGIVQIISLDDGTTPLLSVTSGTIFGDISFYVPPLGRHWKVLCLTYCEVFYISRADILKALYRFPADRFQVFKACKYRMKHARTLYNCKQGVRGLDRSEDEGIQWLKRRWWEISETVTTWKKKLSNHDSVPIEIPPEEFSYHCAKYIGQVVICNEAQQHTKSLFADDKFPWILYPSSMFSMIWYKIVYVTIYQVLIVYPLIITRSHVPSWFRFFQHWTDFVYVADICVSLSTAITSEESASSSFSDIMFYRFKSLYFNLDVLSTIFLEQIAVFIGRPDLYHICLYNRLLKVYMLFSTSYSFKPVTFSNPIASFAYKLALIQFIYSYIVGCSFYLLARNVTNLTKSFWLGDSVCTQPDQSKCDPSLLDAISMAFLWIFELLFSDFPPHSLVDIYICMPLSITTCLLLLFCKSTLIAALYLKLMDACEYQVFVSSVRSHYKTYKIHPNLMTRLNNYLSCHWKYYDGMDVMKPNMLRFEPYDLFWHAHGEVAMNLIGGSMAFRGANPGLVRDLAYKSKFLIIPKGTTVILFGVQSKKINWLSKGSIKTEFPDSDGVIHKSFAVQGELLSFASVFLGRSSIRTYTSYTDVELLFVTRKHFFKILKDYPMEWSYIEKAITETQPEFNKVFDKYVKEHKDYQRTLWERVFHARMSILPKARQSIAPKMPSWLKKITMNIKSDPESRFMFCWCTFRVVVVVVSIMCAALVGSTGPAWVIPLWVLLKCCEVVAFLDILLKMFMHPYYDKKGIIITSTKRVMLHYLCRGFLPDLIGTIPWCDLLQFSPFENMSFTNTILLNTWCKVIHLYLLLGYLDYLADRPSLYSIYLKIVKMQFIMWLLLLAVSQYFVTNCVEFHWNYTTDDLVMKPIRNSWLPNSVVLDSPPTPQQLRMVLAQALMLAQCGLSRINLGLFNVKRQHVGVCIVLFVLGVMFWVVICYTVALTCLCRRSNTLFRHGVGQLKRFLEAERVNKKLIERVLNHFRYRWVRTGGVNLENLMEERMGVVFRQDLSFFFYQSTLSLMDTMLHGGETLQRRISSTLVQVYYEKGADIMREMDLAPWFYVIHRGSVIVTKGGKQLVRLTKGAIFGQLTGTKPRPVFVTVVASEFCDVLQVPIKTFQDLIEDKGRENISKHQNSANDYMDLTVVVPEDPYNTIEYLLRRKKSVQLPGMKGPMEAVSGTWYASWLILSYVLAPVVTAVLTLRTYSIPLTARLTVFAILGIFDLIELLQLVSDFYTVRIIVVNDKCAYRLRKFQLLKSRSFWISIASLVLPYAVFINYDYWWLMLAKLLRLKHLKDYHKQFCNSFRTKATPLVMNFIYVCLTMHAIICGWMYFSCNEFPIKDLKLYDDINKTINYEEWTLPSKRGYGCARMSRTYRVTDESGNETGEVAYSLVVPTKWYHDFIVATTFILIMFTHTDLDCVLPITYQQALVKVLITYLLQLIAIWVLSIAIGSVYMKLRELYFYDYSILKLTTYLMHTGLSPVVLESVKKYTKQLWQRQSGNWLPEMANQAPGCLKEDILAALYMHHLEAPALFRQLPPYFTRQLVTRLHRVVIFPGKSIVKEGDVFPCMYFIHEGEVEKWHTDDSGEIKLLSCLTTCGYFGLIPLLFPTSPHPFTYVTRTVVDLVYLRHHEWQDLLEAYPQDKENLYSAAAANKQHFVDL